MKTYSLKSNEIVTLILIGLFCARFFFLIILRVLKTCYRKKNQMISVVVEKIMDMHPSVPKTELQFFEVE